MNHVISTVFSQQQTVSGRRVIHVYIHVTEVNWLPSFVSPPGGAKAPHWGLSLTLQQRMASVDRQVECCSSLIPHRMKPMCLAWKLSFSWLCWKASTCFSFWTLRPNSIPFCWLGENWVKLYLYGNVELSYCVMICCKAQASSLDGELQCSIARCSSSNRSESWIVFTPRVALLWKKEIKGVSCCRVVPRFIYL